MWYLNSAIRAYWHVTVVRYSDFELATAQVKKIIKVRVHACGSGLRRSVVQYCPSVAEDIELRLGTRCALNADALKASTGHLQLTLPWQPFFRNTGT